MRFLKSANFLKVILNHIILGGHMEGDSRPSWCIQEKEAARWFNGRCLPPRLEEEQLLQVVLSSPCTATACTRTPTLTNKQ